jgi:hypothetical protein
VRNRGTEAEAGASRIRDGEVQMAAEREEVHDDMRDDARREYDRMRQAATRRRHAELEDAEAVQNVQRKRVREEVLNHKQISAVLRKIVNFIANELQIRTICIQQKKSSMYNCFRTCGRS